MHQLELKHIVNIHIRLNTSPSEGKGIPPIGEGAQKAIGVA